MKPQAILPDRISALSERTIHDILSLLPTKTVKMATSLSKTWYDFSSSFPYLDFDDSLFEEKYKDLNLKEAREKYVDYVSETLHRFHERNPITQIKRIRIPITIIDSRIVSILNSWIQLALEHQVEEFDLNTRGVSYELPKTVFQSSSIRVLKLEGCSLYGHFGHRNISGSNTTLRELDLKGVHMDDFDFEKLLSRLPLLRSLKLVDAPVLSKLKVSNDSLIELVVFDCENLQELDIDAPNLLLFEFEGNLPHMSPVHLVMGQSEVSLPYRGWESFDRFFMKLKYFISRMKHVSYLDLSLLECEMILDEEMDGRDCQLVESAPHIDELHIEMYTSVSYRDIFDGLLSNVHPHILTKNPLHSDDYDFKMYIRELIVHSNPDHPSFHANTWHRCLEEITFVAEGVTYRMSVDGTVPPSSLVGNSLSEIKLLFKW